MATAKLTDKQRQMYDYILDNIIETGLPPTISELQKRSGLNSIRGVTVHLDALQQKGYIFRYKSLARGIVVVNRADIEKKLEEKRKPGSVTSSAM